MGQSDYWAEFMRRRLSRRRLLQAGAVAGTGLWVGSAVGCGDGSTSKPAETVQGEATATPQKGGVLRYLSTAAEYAGVDPYITRHFAGATYEKLVRYTPKKDKIVPWLAESWEMPDDTTYIFKMRKGVKFHNVSPVNGRDLEAEDAKYSMDRALTEGPQYPLRPYYTFVNKTEAVDKSTFKLTTSQPFAPLMGNMALQADYIMPKEIVGKDNVAVGAVGTGAFMFDRWDRGEKLVWKRNPDYWIPGQPYLDGIEMRFVADYTSAVAVFVSDQCDIVVVYASDSATVANKRPKAKMVKGTSLLHYTIRFRAGFKPTDDVRVRQAMDLTYSRQDVVFRVAGGVPNYLDYGFKTGPISSDQTQWAVPMSELEKREGYMQTFPKEQAIAKAKKLMAEAGYADGFEVNISNTPEQYRDMAVQLAQSQWKDIGIKVNIKQMDAANFNAAGIKGDWELLQWYTGSSDPDPDGQLYPYFRSGSTGNWARWSDPQLDKLLDEQRSTLNATKRKAVVQDLQKYILDTVPSIWIFDYITFAFATEKLNNVHVYNEGGFAGSFLCFWDQIGQAWLAK